MRLAQALPVAKDKIEVFEFFLYTCPHCFAFDPLLTAWSKQLPSDVVLRRVPVGVGVMHKLHQRLFFALESLGRLGDLHEAVFNAVQRERLELSDEKSISALAVRLGLDQAKFSAAFNSFSAQTRLVQSAKLADAYRVESVPALGIGGRFVTSPSQAGVPGQSELTHGQQTLTVADYLIKLARSKA